MSVPASMVPGTTTTSTELPAFLAGALKDAIERARILSREPYVPYDRSILHERRIAPYFHGQREGHGKAARLTRELPRSFNEYARLAKEYAGNNRDHLFFYKYKDYMNPYENEVVDELGKAAFRNYNRNIIPEISARFKPATDKKGVITNRKLSARHKDFYPELEREYTQEVRNQKNDAMSRGYMSAMEAFNADKARKLEASELMSKLGLAHQSGLLTEIEELQKAAELKRAEEQMKLDIEYEMWKEAQRHPHERLEELFRFLNGVPRTPSSYARRETHEPIYPRRSGIMEGMGMQLLGSLLSGNT